MTEQQRRVAEIMQDAEEEVINRLYRVAAAIIGIQLDEPSRPAAPMSSDPSFPKS